MKARELIDILSHSPDCDIIINEDYNKKIDVIFISETNCITLNNIKILDKFEFGERILVKILDRDDLIKATFIRYSNNNEFPYIVATELREQPFYVQKCIRGWGNDI